MEINWLDLLNSVQDVRSALEVWGITYEVLIALGIAALVLFFISLREIITWYLRISQMQSQMKALSTQLKELKTSVDNIKIESVVMDVTEKKKEPLETALKKFQLDH